MEKLSPIAMTAKKIFIGILLLGLAGFLVLFSVLRSPTEQTDQQEDKAEIRGETIQQFREEAVPAVERSQEEKRNLLRQLQASDE
ncbi:MAG: hypothetical protein Q8P39_04005 [Candidatus Yanofskybacteria bacterium]|nr:hypothetical protein [Candidatus Yanofskybacteria bacterium]